jgi:hypothetical protein
VPAAAVVGPAERTEPADPAPASDVELTMPPELMPETPPDEWPRETSDDTPPRPPGEEDRR